MSKRPVNLTINEKVLGLAKKVMELRGHSSISGFVEELIRDEYERRTGTMKLEEPAGAYPRVAASPEAEPPKPETVHQRIATRYKKSKP